MAADGTPRYGVLGYPVAHSRSPAIHAAAYAALGIDADYQKLPVPPELFAETVRGLPGSGFSGANVTIPHKHAALEVADEVSDTARAIGAANTLTFADGRILADNTDAPGLIAALGEVSGAAALVLGAGGTARAAVWALIDAGAEVSVWNRTAERAAALADDLGARSLESFTPGSFEVVVNTTAVGMDPESTEEDVADSLGLAAADLSDGTTVVDFVYREGGSPLTSAARARGLRVVDGPELLVRQGALSFEIWFGREAPLDAMRAALASS